MKEFQQQQGTLKDRQNWEAGQHGRDEDEAEGAARAHCGGGSEPRFCRQQERARPARL